MQRRLLRQIPCCEAAVRNQAVEDDSTLWFLWHLLAKRDQLRSLGLDMHEPLQLFGLRFGVQLFDTWDVVVRGRRTLELRSLHFHLHRRRRAGWCHVWEDHTTGGADSASNFVWRWETVSLTAGSAGFRCLDLLTNV